MFFGLNILVLFFSFLALMIIFLQWNASPFCNLLQRVGLPINHAFLLVVLLLYFCLYQYLYLSSATTLTACLSATACPYHLPPSRYPPLIFTAAPFFYSTHHYHHHHHLILLWVKIIAIHTLLVLKLFGLKIWSCIFIGPRSDHSIPMSVTDWLTHWFTTLLKIEWIDLNVQNLQTQPIKQNYWLK